MVNKKLIFALVLLVMAISSVSAGDLNSTDDVYGHGDNDFEAALQNSSSVLMSESDGEGLAEDNSDVLSAGTVYFNASSSTDGVGTQTSPYKYLYSNRISSGMTAYFADGVYVYTGSGKISSKTTFIGQSRDNTIIKSTASYYFDLTVSSGSTLVLNGLTFDYGRIINHGDVEADNVIFKNSVCKYSESSSAFYEGACGGVIFSNSSVEYGICNVNLRNCYFESNHARHGSAIAANYTNIVISDCIFSNSDAGRFGGAIYGLNSNLTVSKSSFTRSSAKYGGAIYMNYGKMELTDSNFTNSEAYSFGGAIASKLSTSTISGCNFLNSWSLTDSGGVIYAENGTLIISKSCFENGIGDFGGAICALNMSLDIGCSNFINNTANFGGSVFTIYGNTYIHDSNIISSFAYNHGDAICSYLPKSIGLADNVFTDSDGLYVFAKYDSLFYGSGNAGLTNVMIFNTTLFDISSDVVAPIINYSPHSPEAIPSSYDSRDYGYVTSVKNQMDGGNCWAFASVAALEICLKKATGIEFDFSEENIKNIMALYSLVGRDCEPNDGGFDAMGFGYFTNWFGPIYDSWDVYDDYSALSTLYAPLLHVQNVYFLPVRKDSNDNDAIKRAIMDYGAVVATTYWETSFHSITLVGWKDDYNARDYFGNYAKGVWIVKNSWGSSSDDGGYVYVSYEKDFRNEISTNYHNYIYTYVFNDTESYVRNYQYDLQGVNYYLTSSGNTVKYKNVFTAMDDEALSAFSTFFKNPTNYRVSLYKDNTLVLTQQGYSPAGYYTIPFKSKTALSKGDEFTICIEILGSEEKFIPMSDSEVANFGTFKDGVSYIDLGSGWRDLYSYYDTPMVACIKAFTTPLELNQVTLSVNQISSVGVNDEVIFNFKLADSQLSGLVTVKINDQTYYSIVKDGQASLKLKFNTIGNCSFSAQYKNNLYASNTVNFNFSVVIISDVVISAPDFSKYYGASDMFTIRITDNGKPVSGASVRYIRDSNVVTMTTNSNGYAYVDIGLIPGTYFVKSEYGNKSVTSKITVKSTISVSDLTCDYGSAYLKAAFLDVDGSALSNADVQFYVENTTYYAKTDSNGVASYSSGLNAGTYTVTAINPSSGETKSFHLTVNKLNSAISLTSDQSDGLVTLTASLSPLSDDGVVIFTIGSTHLNFTRPVSSGKATLTLNFTDEGIYYAYATFVGSANFNSARSSEISIIISDRHNIVISSPDLTKYYGSSDRLVIRVTDNGRPVSNADVMYSNSFTSGIVFTNSNGYAYLDIDFVPGTYSVVSEYGGESVSSWVTVKSTIAVSDLTYSYGSAYLKATFLDVDGSALSNADVQFNVGDSTYYAKTDGNGVASYSSSLNVGIYDVAAVNPSSGETKSFRLTVNKVSPAISLNYVKNGTLVTLTAGLTPLYAEGDVIFTIGGNRANFTRQISSGKATLGLNLTTDGIYKVYATFVGNDNFYSAGSSEISIVVSGEHNIAISAPDVTKYYGSSDKLVVRITDNGKPVSDAAIRYNRDSGSVTVITNSEGYAYVGVDFVPGSYSLVSEYGGKSVSSKVTVKSTISVSDMIYEYGSAYLKAAFLNVDGRALSNADVHFKIGSSTFTARTNGNGVATYSIKFGVGEYNVIAVNPVNGETKSFKLTVKPISNRIYVVDNFKKVYGDSKKLNIVVKSDSGSAVSNYPLSISIKGNSVKPTLLRTDSKGQANFVCNFKPGKYFVEIDGNGVLHSSVVVTVKKATPKLLVAKKTFKRSLKIKKYSITLKDNNNKVMKSKKVTIKVNGKSYVAKTNSKGKATFKITKLTKKGTFVASVSFAGNAYYNKISKKVKLYIK